MQYNLNRTFSGARWMRATLCFAVTWLCASSMSVNGQECYPPEVPEAVTSRVKLRIAQVPLKVTQLPKLKEELIGLEQGNHGENSEFRAVQFFEVSPATYQVVNGKIVGVTIQLDNDSVWVVGVGPDKAIYRLAGFSDSVSDFNSIG